MRASALGLLLAGFASTGFAADTDLAAKVEELGQSYVKWGPVSGTPGAALSFRELSQSGRKHTYHLIVTGLPREGTYMLVQWPINGKAPTVNFSPVFIDATGVLLCKKNGDVNSSADTLNLTIDNVRGEPARLAVVGLPNRKIMALSKITPNPIEAIDGNCHLSATYLTPHGEVVFVEAAGLAPNEAFTMNLHSGSKDVQQEGKANATGDYKISFLPIDPKSTSKNGRATVALHAASCSTSVELAWGDLTIQ